MKHSLDTLARVLDYAQQSGASAADAVLFSSQELSISRRLGKPENIERAEDTTLGLRVFIGHKQAMVSTAEFSPDALLRLAERGVAMAALGTEDPDNGLVSTDLLATDITDLDLFDAAEPTPEWLLEQCAIAEDAALSTPGIRNSEGADAGYGTTHICLATSHGFSADYRASHASLSVSVLAGDDEAMERDYDYSSTRYVSDLTRADVIGKKAAERALRRIRPQKISSSELPIIFDPRVGRSLLNSFASAISGASIVRGTSFLKDKMRAPLFSEHIRIIDDPLRKRGLASRPFDGEGVATKKHVIVDHGVLQTWLLDARSARKLGLRTTGHAARGASSAPSPSCSNLYMENGTQSVADLISDIEQGFYVTETFGMGVNLVTGDYSQGASGFWIEKGEITFAVSEVTIAGHLLDMMKTLTPANDLEFKYGTNTPTLRVEKMMVAGT